MNTIMRNALSAAAFRSLNSVALHVDASSLYSPDILRLKGQRKRRHTKLITSRRNHRRRRSTCNNGNCNSREEFLRKRIAYCSWNTPEPTTVGWMYS